MTPLFVTGAFTRRGIQTRVMLLVGIGVLAALAIFGVASGIGLQRLVARLAAERQLLAGSVAEHLDYVVQADMEILQGVGAPPLAPGGSSETLPDQAVLRDAYLRSRLAERVFVIGRGRTLLAEEPAARYGGAAPPAEEVEAAFRSGRPTASPRVSGTPPRLYLLVPMRDWRGQVTALAGAEIDPSGSRVAGLLDGFRLGAGVEVDAVDAAGTIIASTTPGRRLAPVEHREALAPRLAAREGFVDVGTSGGQTGVSALAPLRAAPWGLVIRQDEAETFGRLRALRRMVWWLGPALLALALLFAWGAARSVRRPLAVLTRSAEGIAAGDLDKPIPPLADDEVGRLGRSLERMRAALKASLETIAHSNQELEQRVEARTRELHSLYSQLRERDEWREELLRKVISAQEDERRRLARELHDETSQTMSALAMKIETALAAWPAAGSRDRLLEAKALTVRTLEELHRLIFDLRPSVLDDLGLLSAIRWYAERHLGGRGVAVRCEFSGSEARLTPELETALFRVAQEAITNIAKHSGAETVLIQVLERDEDISIEIEDDGRGFDPSSLPPPAARERGLGLLGMRERVELFGGHIDIDSAPGRGTRIAVTAPLRPEVVHGQDSSAHRG